MSDKNLCISCLSVGFGGLELNTLKLAGWLREYGWHVSLLLLKDSRLHKAAPDYCGDIEVIPGVAFLKWKKLYYIYKWIKRKDCRIFFTAFSKDIAAAAIYKRIWNKKLIMVYQQQMKVGVNKRDLLHRLRYNMVNCWISPLIYLKEETLSRTTIPEEKIKLIPLCIEGERFFDNPVTKNRARSSLGLSPGSNIIGVLGRLDPEKGQDFMIRCIRRLKDDHGLDYELLIMGDKTVGLKDDYNHLLQELISSLNLQEAIHFRPFNQEVSFFYKAIDVFAMASRGEPFGMVVIEAMASGCPVISTNRDGPAEILEGGALGYLFENDDEEGFCKQLIALSRNPLMPEILTKAENAVRNQYTKQNLCDQLDSLLTGLLNR
jgi:D-inositol-3-phosphate glycosyltransferase